jgi:hypothetical protein
MSDIARHIRIFEKDPSDDLVQKRTTAITTAAEQFKKLKFVTDLLELANDIATAVSSDDFALSDVRTTELEGFIKAGSPAFVRDNEALQILVCAMLAALEVVGESASSNHGWSHAEWIAAGLWSALSFQKASRKPRLEALRLELLTASRDLVLRTSESARARQTVPDLVLKVAETVEVNKLPDAIKSAAGKTIESLRRNAALDREEIDLLWWALSDWSSLFDESYVSLPNTTAAVAAGVEAGKLMRRFPSESHKHLALRRIHSKQKLGLQALVDELGKHAEVISSVFAEGSSLERFPTVFPLLTALRGKVVVDKILPLREWGVRAFLESAILQVEQQGLTLG